MSYKRKKTPQWAFEIIIIIISKVRIIFAELTFSVSSPPRVAKLLLS